MSVPLTAWSNSAGKESIVRLVAPAHTTPTLGRVGVEGAAVAAARSRVWPNAPFTGGGPESGLGLVKNTAPSFCIHGAGAIVSKLVAGGA